MLLSKRSLVVGGLVLLPILFYVALGSYAMWITGLFWWSWIFLPVCWLAAWATSRFWPSQSIAEMVDAPTGAHFTNRDSGAAEIVRSFQNNVDQLTAAQLTDPHFYLNTVRDLATELAHHYHPKAKDPYSSLKVTEILAAVRLAVDDLESLAIKSIPGSRLLTIGQWKSLQHAPKWVKRVQDTVWLGSILINPANILRYYTSKKAIDPITDEIQSEILAVIYLRFIRQVGYYLIEMNSGRLRGGADAYRSTFGTPKSVVEEVRGTADGDIQPQRTSSPKVQLDNVSIALVGQVSSGKSALVNLLLGSDIAASDILPTTRLVNRYQWDLPDGEGKVQLLDTPGYGEAGASAQQLGEIQSALREADLLLLIMDAHSPARKADVTTLNQIDQYYLTNPSLKQPKSVGVLTHVDLLSPMMEWNPPYSWRTSDDRKSNSIRQAVQYVTEVFGSRLSQVAPVSLTNQKDQVWGVEEEILPLVAQILPDAKSAALLKAYERQLDQDRWWLLLDQLKESGLTIAKYWMETRGQKK